MDKEVSLDNFGDVIKVSNVEIETDLEYQIYFRVMENELLREVPTILQNNRQVQEGIKKKVQLLFDLKNKGDYILEKERETGEEYNEVLEKAKEGRFEDIKWIYPVVLDEHLIYSLKCKEEEENDGCEDIPNPTGKPLFGDKLENQMEQMREIQGLYRRYKKGEINMVSFYSGLSKQRESYRKAPDEYWNKKLPRANNIKLVDYTSLYRFINLIPFDKCRYKKRVGKGPREISLVLPEEKKEVEDNTQDYKTTSITVETGENISIVGFFYLPEGNEDLLQEAIEKKIIYKNPEDIKLDAPYLFLFTDAKDQHDYNVDPKIYENILKDLVPSPKKVIEFLSKNNPDIDNLISNLQKWGYNLGNISYDSWQVAKEFLEKEKETDRIVTGYNVQECREDKVLEDIYGIKCGDPIKMRDGGLYYYLSKYSKSQPNLKRLKEIKKKLTAEVENLKKMAKEDQEIKVEGNFTTLKEEFKKAIKIPKKSFHSKEKLEETEEYLNKINNEINNTKKNKDEYTELLEKSKLFLSYKKPEIVKKTTPQKVTLTIFDDVPDELKDVLSEVNKTASYVEKKELIYTIIKYDGILIDNFIYSIYYNKPFLCGHWYYLMKIENSEDKNMYINKLLSIYGSDDKGDESCTVCGAFLERAKLVESTYIDTLGYSLMLREAYQDELRKIRYRHSLPLSQYDYLSENVKDCESSEFNNFLKGLSKDRSVQACKLINGICKKIGISLHPRHFIELVATCARESGKISTIEAYFDEKIRELKTKNNYTNNKIMKMRESSKFKDKITISYYKFFSLKYSTLIVAHLLWHLRTSIPDYKPENPITSCSFFGFNGNNGFDYMLCILNEMKVMRLRMSFRGETIDEPFSKSKIINNLRYWENILEPGYKNAKLRRLNYLRDTKVFAKREGSSKMNNVPQYKAETKSLKEIDTLLVDYKKKPSYEKYITLYNNILEIIKRSHHTKSI
jgi:hypothetical protein